MAKKDKKEKIVYVDDGRTIYDMSLVTRPGEVVLPENQNGKDKPKKEDKNKSNKSSGIELTKSERWALIKAAYATYLPILFIGLLGLAVAVGLFMLIWG